MSSGNPLDPKALLEQAFEMDEANHPRALAGASRDSLIAGARACPVAAITLIDATTGQRIAP